MKGMNNYRICAVVVTYNRKDLLEQCVKAILNQTFKISKLIIIDNASTDGTRLMLVQNEYMSNPVIDYTLMGKNIGGAGGFYEGLKRALKFSPDWVWLMDDDTIPTPTCLNELLKGYSYIATHQKVSFLASTVYGDNDEYMNVPSLSQKSAPNGYPYWYEYLEKGIVSISVATFVSILINSDAIKQCGLPDPDFFIWGDDTEYTYRLTSFYGDAFFVGSSKAIHKRVIKKPLSIETETDIKRIKLHHYDYRNTVIFNQYYKMRFARTRAFASLLLSVRYLFQNHGYTKMKTRIIGILEGLIQYPRFKKYIDEQLLYGYRLET